MPQTFHVLRCYRCEVFQVHQFKKTKSWKCKMCNESQSMKKVYTEGGGAECRHYVQKLNLQQGGQGSYRPSESVVRVTRDKTIEEDSRRSPYEEHSRWAPYLENNNVIAEESDGEERTGENKKNTSIYKREKNQTARASKHRKTGSHVTSTSGEQLRKNGQSLVQCEAPSRCGLNTTYSSISQQFPDNKTKQSAHDDNNVAEDDNKRFPADSTFTPASNMNNSKWSRFLTQDKRGDSDSDE